MRYYLGMAWQQLTQLPPRTFICGYCSNQVGSDKGIATQNTPQGFIYICPICDKPSFFGGTIRSPGAPYGNAVDHVPASVNTLYNEARTCFAASAYTAAVLLCRKLLMNVSVSVGAGAGLKFIEYVEYLAANGYVPPNGKGWVDHIRKKGNEATHEIQIMGEQDAKDLISFSEMLLKFIFEFPNKIAPLNKPP
jgi:hypothetical protein